jgi:uncharacterized membrane protein
MDFYPVTIKNTLIIFFLAGLIGWIILCIFGGKLTGYMWENYKIPFKPMFAIGAVLIYLIYPFVSQYNIFIQFILYAVILTLLESIMFLFAEKVLHLQFECYYNNKRIAPLYSVYWGLLAVLLTQVLSGNYFTYLNLLIVLILAVFAILVSDGYRSMIKLDPHNNKPTFDCYK